VYLCDHPKLCEILLFTQEEENEMTTKKKKQQQQLWNIKNKMVGQSMS